LLWAIVIFRYSQKYGFLSSNQPHVAATAISKREIAVATPFADTRLAICAPLGDRGILIWEVGSCVNSRRALRR
jgi:hypothetical protein